MRERSEQPPAPRHAKIPCGPDGAHADVGGEDRVFGGDLTSQSGEVLGMDGTLSLNPLDVPIQPGSGLAIVLERVV